MFIKGFIKLTSATSGNKIYLNSNRIVSIKVAENPKHSIIKMHNYSPEIEVKESMRKVLRKIKRAGVTVIT